MLSLLELQHRFACALEQGDEAGAAIFHGPAARTLARLAVYRGNDHANRTTALASAYPVVRKIVGEDFFEATARQFARAHPSTSGDLNRYGDCFASFLADFPHTADLPYLPDVARLEWLAHRAHFAADPAPFDASSLGGAADAGEELRAALAPACALLESPWPLARIWAVHQDDHEGEIEVDLQSGPDRVLVHRPRWRALVQPLAAGDFAFLNGALRGETLGEALESGDQDANFDPATALARWIQAGVITSLV